MSKTPAYGSAQEHLLEAEGGQGSQPCDVPCPVWVPTALSGLVLALYAGFPTRNYYWDGVSFALDIESAEKLPLSLLHPNHLVYNGIGCIVWSAARALGIDARPITVLQGRVRL